MSSPHDGIQSGTHNNGVHAGTSQHGHDDHSTPLVLPYSDADIAGFRKDDIHAGKMVVMLMAGIFSIGVVLYILVALSTWQLVDATRAY